jgi:hypothetical protein
MVTLLHLWEQCNRSEFHASTMSFNLSEVIHIIATVDELLSMSDRPYNINTSSGHEIKGDEEVEFVMFTFPLKNGISHIKIHDSTGLIEYTNQNGEVLSTIEFDDVCVTKINGSFRKGFKQIREFDRNQSRTVELPETLVQTHPSN